MHMWSQDNEYLLQWNNNINNNNKNNKYLQRSQKCSLIEWYPLIKWIKWLRNKNVWFKKEKQKTLKYDSIEFGMQ